MINDYTNQIEAIKIMANVYSKSEEKAEERDYKKMALEFVRAFKFIYSLFALDVSVDFGICHFLKTKNGIEMTYHRVGDLCGRCTMSDINNPSFTFSSCIYPKKLPNDMVYVYKDIPEDVLRFLFTREYENCAEEIISAQQRIVSKLKFMNELECKFNTADAANQLKIMHRLDALKQEVKKEKIIRINANQNRQHNYDDEPYYIDLDMDRFPDIC